MEKQATPVVDPIPKFNPCFNLSITTNSTAPNTFGDALGCDSSNVLEVDMRDDTIEKQRLKINVVELSMHRKSMKK